MLAAADAVLMNDPAAALRLALRAQQAENSVLAAKTVAAAHSELGRPDLARGVAGRGRPLVAGEDDRLTYAAEDLSLALWGERDPQRAWAIVDRLRTEMPESANAVLGAEAVVRLFTGGCVEVVELARRILDGEPDPSSRIRALTCLTGALAFADRGPEAIAAGQQLLDALSETRVSATRTGLAYALVAVTGVFYGVEYQLPRPVGTSGRWPGEPEQLEGPTAIPAGAAPVVSRTRGRSRLAVPRRGPAAFPRRSAGCGGAVARGLCAAAVGHRAVPVRGHGGAGDRAGRAGPVRGGGRDHAG